MAVYFASTTGSDGNSGSISQPFATLEHADQLAQPGDTIYLRGGTYVLDEVLTLTKSGTSGNPITIASYQGEKVVLDGSGIPTPSEFNGRAVHLTNVSWNHIKGIEITNGPDGGLLIDGNSSNNVFEQIAAHHNGRASVAEGSGIAIYGTGANNLFLNCDSYANYDVLGGGENADGFDIDAGTGNVLRGCRAWQNSDDGFDFFNASFASNHVGNAVRIEDSWAWGNGYDANGNPAGDGDGFKLGGQRPGLDNTSGGHVVINCVAWGNLSDGFEGNDAAISITLLNNTAYDNQSQNYHFNTGGHVLKNNLSYDSPEALYFAPGTKQVTNSWNLSVVVSGTDFVSLNDATARGARKADGSLPDTTFLHLVPGSDLIDRGVNVGLPSVGAPDLGAFEAGKVLDNGGQPGKTIVGTKHADRLHGTDRDDTLKGKGGKDKLYGNGGDDVLKGGPGKDVLKGGPGNDLLVGNKGNDKLRGEDGNDVLKGGSGKDVLDGGAGDDVLTGNGGKDKFLFKGSFGGDRIIDFQSGVDKIGFEKEVFSNFSDIKDAMTEVGPGVIIEAPTGSVLVEGVKLTDFHSKDFLFL